MDINSKLPMRNEALTNEIYMNKLIIKKFSDFGDYLIIGKDTIEVHFFEFKEHEPKENYVQVYVRSNDIDTPYKSLLDNKTPIHPNGKLQSKSWRQSEFALLHPENKLFNFCQCF